MTIGNFFHVGKVKFVPCKGPFDDSIKKNIKKKKKKTWALGVWVVSAQLPRPVAFNLFRQKEGKLPAWMTF